MKTCSWLDVYSPLVIFKGERKREENIFMFAPTQGFSLLRRKLIF